MNPKTLQTKTKERIILNIKVPYAGEPQEKCVTIRGIDFRIIEHSVDWCLDLAKKLVTSFDGYVDGIIFTGLPHIGRVGKLEIVNRGSADLIKTVKKSSHYGPYDIRKIFASWSIRRLVRQYPHFFTSKRILFHAGIINPALQPIANEAKQIKFGDCLAFSGLPTLLTGTKQLSVFARCIRKFLESTDPEKASQRRICCDLDHRTLSRWIADADIFVSTEAQLNQMSSWESLAGKILIIDRLPIEVRQRLDEVGVNQYLELIPHINGLENITSSSLLRAIIDLCRVAENSRKDFEEYALGFIEEENLRPSQITELKPVVDRCAFVVHPLSERDIFRAPRLQWLEKTSGPIKHLAASGIARLPIFKHGEITGIKSEKTGRELVCDIYAMPATPKQLKNMDEEFVYKRLVQAAEMARRDGSSIMGLGAYTKVVGDSGITVARRAPIPITNGNSYSAAATIWAAQEMTRALGFVESYEKGKKINARAMVIGATGSIGRVSALLLARVFKHVVLVATRVDKLLEVRDEIHEMDPEVEISIGRNPNPFLGIIDVIVTATSNQDGCILDIDKVKPGAVICDCSRPLDISKEEALRRPDVMVIESGEIDLPGELKFSCDIGLPYPSVYACLAETAVLSLERRFESYSLGRELSIHKVKEIYKLSLKHGAKLAAIQGPNGFITESQIARCRHLATVNRHRMQTSSPQRIAAAHV